LARAEGGENDDDAFPRSFPGGGTRLAWYFERRGDVAGRLCRRHVRLPLVWPPVARRARRRARVPVPSGEVGVCGAAGRRWPPALALFTAHSGGGRTRATFLQDALPLNAGSRRRPSEFRVHLSCRCGVSTSAASSSLNERTASTRSHASFDRRSAIQIKPKGH